MMSNGPGVGSEAEANPAPGRYLDELEAIPSCILVSLTQRDLEWLVGIEVAGQPILLAANRVELDRALQLGDQASILCLNQGCLRVRKIPSSKPEINPKKPSRIGDDKHDQQR